MKIFDFDESIFSKEVLKETAALSLEISEMLVSASQFDDEIWECSEKLRRAQVVLGAPSELRGAGLAVDRARVKKRQVKTQSDNRRQACFSRLEELNLSTINYLCECANEAIERLRKVVVFRRLGTDKNSFTDQKYSQCESNLEKVGDAREALLAFRDRVRSLIHSSGQEILNETEAFAEKINSLTFKAETITLLPSQVSEVEESLKGVTSSPALPQVPQPTDSYLWARFDALKRVLKG